MKSIVIILVVLGVALGAKLPSDWVSCKGNSDLNKCLQSAIEDVLPKLKNGFSDLNVPALEPLVVPSVTIGEGKGAVNVVQNYKDFNIFGISTAKIPKLNAKLTPDGIEMDLEAFIPETRFEADYKFNGRVLLLPIVGDGKARVTLTELKINIKIETKKIEKKGKSYLQVTNFDVKVFPGKVVYNFENLFNGDKRLGSEMNRLLNDNWKDVLDDIKEGYEKMLGTVCESYANQVFGKLSYDELF